MEFRFLWIRFKGKIQVSIPVEFGFSPPRWWPNFWSESLRRFSVILDKDEIRFKLENPSVILILPYPKVAEFL